MGFKRLDKNAPVFAGLSDITIGDCLRAGVTNISFRVVPAIERGCIIKGMANIRDCPMSALVGPVKFETSSSGHEAIQDHLAKLLCWHPNRNARRAAASILALSLTDLASDIVEAGQHNPEYRDALLSLNLDEAASILQEVMWPAEFPLDRARKILEIMGLVERAFDVQRTAAWAWRMIHAPFDNVLGEANFDGYATITSCASNIKQRRADFRFALDLYRAGADSVSLKSFRFLSRYGLGHLRTRHPEKIYEMFGKERVAQISEIIEVCNHQVEQWDAILAEIEGGLPTANENSIVDYRPKRLDTFLTPVSSVVILAMKCAALSRIMSGVDVDEARDPPAWLTKPCTKDISDRLGKARFFQLFLFYRGVFVQDVPGITLSVPKNECRSEDRVDELADLYRPSKRQCQDVLADMRSCIENGTYGVGPEAPGPSAAFGKKFGWREAA